MKNHSKILLLCLAAGLASLPVLRAEDAPPPPPPGEAGGPGGPGGGHRGERMQEHMIKALGLTADQETKWKALGQQERDAGKAIHDDTSLSKEQKWAKQKSLRESYDGQRRALLTPDQQTKFDEMLAKMKERREGHDGPPPPPPAPAADGK